eukprot:3941573-Rhodomonas_salina.6
MVIRARCLQRVVLARSVHCSTMAQESSEPAQGTSPNRFARYRLCLCTLPNSCARCPLQACTLSPVRLHVVVHYVAICLRACYAMSGTDIGYGAICLRACYGMSGTDIGYGARYQPQPAIYQVAVSYPTHLLCDFQYRDRAWYGAIVLRTLLCDVRVWCYAICGTEIAYGATSASPLAPEVMQFLDTHSK